jgi:hypothetical protein
VEKLLVLYRKSCPQLPEKSNRPPVVRPEWNIELPRGDMDQVEELLDIIAAHKEMGVTGASVMFSFFKPSPANSAMPYTWIRVQGR